VIIERVPAGLVRLSSPDTECPGHCCRQRISLGSLGPSVRLSLWSESAEREQVEYCSASRLSSGSRAATASRSAASRSGSASAAT